MIITGVNGYTSAQNFGRKGLIGDYMKVEEKLEDLRRKATGAEVSLRNIPTDQECKKQLEILKKQIEKYEKFEKILMDKIDLMA